MSAPGGPRVVLVDDHRLFRSGVRAELDGVVHGGRRSDDVHVPLEPGPHAGAEQLVVVDDHDARRHGAPRGSASSTSVPAGEGWICARPPYRRMRPTMDSRTPRRSPGTAPGSNPGPRSRTKTSTPSGVASAKTRTG